MSATKSNVLSIAPDLAAVPDVTFDTYLALSLFYIDQTSFGTMAVMAQSFLCAHLITSMGFGCNASLTSPGVASLTVGPNSISFSGSAQSADTDYSRTKYGQQFLALRALVTAGGLSIWPTEALTAYDLTWVEVA